MSMIRLFAAAKRRNGKTLLSPEAAKELLRAHGRRVTDVLDGCELGVERIVSAACSVIVAGVEWFIPSYYAPGERVLCFRALSGDSLLIRGFQTTGPDILVERVGPAHNHLRSGHGSCIYTSGGTPTMYGQALRGSSGHPQGTGAPPPSANPSEHRRSHTTDTTPAAPGGDSSPIAREAECSPCTPPCRQCTHRPPACGARCWVCSWLWGCSSRPPVSSQRPEV